MKKILDLFSQVILSLILLTAAVQSGADCMPDTSVTLINAWQDVDWDGPYAKFAIPHSALSSNTGKSSVGLIGTGGIALCKLAPFYVAVPCALTVSAELGWMLRSDQGFGVFANFHYDGLVGGFWSFTSADSICGPVTPVLPSLSTGTRQGGETCDINSDCQSGLCMQPGPGSGTGLRPTAQCLGNSAKVTFSTQGGFFLTAENGGGLVGPTSPDTSQIPNVISVTTARQGCLDIQPDGNMTDLVGQFCNGKTSCSYKSPGQQSNSASRTFCTQGLEITYQCTNNSSAVVTVPGDAWKHGPAQLACNPPSLPTDASGSAFYTTATKQLDREIFTCNLTLPNQLSIKTNGGQWVTAVNGGGIGGPAADPWEIQTNRTQASSWETFTILTNDANQCSFKTNSGNFVSAVNGGGYGNNDTANTFPMHTNSMAPTPGAWEMFTINPQ